LAADAVGYSRLMEADERTTVAALDAAREVFKREIESNHGHVINMAGDSVLAVFDAAAGAVTAALAVQRTLDASSHDVPEHPNFAHPRPTKEARLHALTKVGLVASRCPACTALIRACPFHAKKA
jgi:class 3 adenylate cyclase